MELTNASINFSGDDATTVANNFKALTSFMNEQIKLFGDKPIARYLSNTDDYYKFLTYADADHIATNLACTWALKGAKNANVISFLYDHNVHYLVILLALMKLRVTVLLLSTRNSEAADTNLLEKTNSKLLIASVKYEDIAKGASSKVLSSGGDIELLLLQPLNIDDLIKEPLHPNCEFILDLNFSDDDIKKNALIIHSSGTTSFPKPIYLSNLYLFTLMNFGNFQSEYKNLKSLISDDAILSFTPLFHVSGVFSAFMMASVGGNIVFLNKLPPSNEEIVKALIENNCTMMCATPLILEQLIPYITRTDNFTSLQKLRFIIIGGAPLKKETGDWFQNHEINVRNFYGTTEIGMMMTTNLDDDKSKNWNSIRPYLKDKDGNYYGCFELNNPESDPTVYHFYVRPGYPGLANVSNREDGGYNTDDLFKEDPDYPGFYIYLGRRDDTLVMVNGEKTNPIPMEISLRQRPIIKQAAIIGHGKQFTAALIELDKQYAFDYSPDEIIDEVNKAVHQMNTECPNHSTVLPQMAKILPFNKSLPSTDKGTVQRKKAEQMYQDIVDKMYKGFLEGPSKKKISNNDDDNTSTWTKEQTQEFLITFTSEVLHLPKSEFIKDLDQSIFDLGLNSLTAIQLRNKISGYYDNVSQNFLFQHPSIHSMCEALMNHQQNEDGSEQLAKRIQQTEDLAKDYINKAKMDFPIIAKNDYLNNNNKKEKIILLTGATGSLGSFMLAYLLKNPEVKKVYCCIRGVKNDDQLKQRLENAFISRELDVTLLKDSNRVKVLPMTFNEPFLGFGKERYYQLKNEITIIQHCAWLLDFNMPVDHFDKECIAPFYHLLKFAYHETNPMHVHFVSSASATAAYGSEILEEPVPFDVKRALPIGYSQSKFIVEIIFDYLTTEKNFPCYIERLGQVCGDSVNGVWNTSEQYPLMFIGGGAMMHKMPQMDTMTVDWIPVDYAAQTIADIMLRTAYDSAHRDQSVYHIVNPQLIQWKDILQAMKEAGMTFDIVSPSDWVESLSQDDMNPAYTLMGFYEDNFNDVINMPVWKTTKTVALAPILAKTPVLNANLFSKFLKRWQSVGFYHLSA